MPQHAAANTFRAAYNAAAAHHTEEQWGYQTTSKQAQEIYEEMRRLDAIRKARGRTRPIIRRSPPPQIWHRAAVSPSGERLTRIGFVTSSSSPTRPEHCQPHSTLPSHSRSPRLTERWQRSRHAGKSASHTPRVGETWSPPRHGRGAPSLGRGLWFCWRSWGAWALVISNLCCDPSHDGREPIKALLGREGSARVPFDHVQFERSL